MKTKQPVVTNEKPKENKVEKTKSVKAFTITEGDIIGHLEKGKEGMYLVKNEVSKVSELDKEFLTFDYAGGGFGIFGRRNFVNKVIQRNKK